ncbi:MAG: tetratricopeptide repeat protein [Polyangiaceae bacterium]|nr:tetratricopeptide repeat protein [Polyangiaceae bacterium]
MRAALYFPPNDHSSEFTPPLTPEALRRMLDEKVGRLLPVSEHLSFEQVIREALQLGSGAATSTVLLYAGPHLAFDETTARELGLDDHFEMATQYVAEEVEQTLADAFDRAAHDDVAGATRSYRAADALLGNESSARHALVLVSLGDLERQQGRTREAALLLDRALAIAPDHIGALRGRAALAREMGESVVAAALLHRLVPHLDAEAERLDALSLIASESLRAARDAILQALTWRPNDRALLERLRAAHEAAGSWSEAVDVSVRIAEGIGAPKERARALVQAARLASEKAGNRRVAIALYEAAIEDDPSVSGAFEAIEAEFIQAEDFVGVTRAYERQLERLASADADARVELLRKLALTHRDRLADPERAISALDRLVLERPQDADARIQLAALLHETDQIALATRVLEIAAELAPDRPETYRSLLTLLDRVGDADRAYNASAVLVALGEADINEQLRYAQYAPESLVHVGAVMDDDVWDQLTLPQHPRSVHELMVAVEGAALATWFDEHGSRARGSVPPPNARQDPNRTTILAVKTFHWASRVLGVPEHAIYASPENPRLTVATLPTSAPALVLGRAALTGRSVTELAFMAGHHLAFSRPGCRLLAFYPDLDSLRTLARAAAAIGHPELGASLDDNARAMQNRLAKYLDPAQRERAREAVDRLLVEGKVEVGGWLRSIETMACRAALLISGDVTVAAGVLAITGAPPDGRSARERGRQLLPFAVSQSHSALRHLLGIAVG